MEHAQTIFPLIDSMGELKILAQLHLREAIAFARDNPAITPVALTAFWKVFMY